MVLIIKKKNNVSFEITNEIKGKLYNTFGPYVLLLAEAVVDALPPKDFPAVPKKVVMIKIEE